MKKLMLIVVAVFSMTALFAQGPTIINGAQTCNETMDHVFYIDYMQYIKGSSFKVLPGAGNVDLIPDGQPDAFLDAGTYTVTAREDCKYLKLKVLDDFNFPATNTYTIPFQVIDSQGNVSNTAFIYVTIKWGNNPQHVIFDPCKENID